jgi:phenylalanyl-tRNA synthetase alpha chain
MTAQETIDDIRTRAMAELDAAASLDEVVAWERAFLGPKGELTLFLRGLASLPADQRPIAGRGGNTLKTELTAAWSARHDALVAEDLEQRLAGDAVDVTLPGRPPILGASHPVSQMIDELSEIFALLGFQTVFGPEVETAHYNFDLLNIPKDHPARDVWDTIFIQSEQKEITLRPHTSPMQVRTMLETEPPVRVVVPGRTYRYEAQDATHEWMFYQVEGLAVDEGLTMADLKGTLFAFARHLFGTKVRVRFRCDYFPFVEPGVDMSISTPDLRGGAWLEIMGAGMVHPRVLRMAGYDPDRYTGFAFGLGPERVAMPKYGIPDIRTFYANDPRFLEQFAS